MGRRSFRRPSRAGQRERSVREMAGPQNVRFRSTESRNTESRNKPESIEPEWKEEADVNVPWLSGHFSREARQEKRHCHSALIGARQDVFSFFLSHCVDDAAFIF